MMSLTQLLYWLTIVFIRSVKWIEHQFLKIFSSWITSKCVNICGEIGIIFHFTGDSYKNWGPAEEEAALAKCKKYDRLVHLRVHDKRIFTEVVNTCTWGLGEGFVKGKWSFCKDERDVVNFVMRFLENGFIGLYYNWWNQVWSYLEFGLFNLQTRARAWEVARKHYDLGNDLYEAMLDPYLQYSCGYWKSSDNLNDAQQAKMELIAQKLKLKPGMRVLDIGCGWGMLCKYLAEKHGVECVGVTISKEGTAYGRNICQGLPVEIRLQDYRDLDERFDRIVSVGMFEHVGKKNYDEYFKVVERNLKDDGIALLHTIGVNRKDIYPNHGERWTCTYIFPNGSLPRPQDIIQSAEDRFILEDWQNFGFDYSKTLAAWRGNFMKNWPSLEGKYEEDFYRMWIYYLCICEAVFKCKRHQLWQVVFSKGGLENYTSAR